MKFELAILVLLAGTCSIIVCGCTSASGDQAQSLPTITMQIGKERFALEVANSEPSREKGLMYRDSMPADHGMLFVMERTEVQGFWMKNTHIPLDIIFLSPEAKVVSIHQMEAFDLRTTYSDYPAKYAIELNQGAAEKAGVKVGDTLQIPSLPADPGTKPTSTQAR